MTAKVDSMGTLSHGMSTWPPWMLNLLETFDRLQTEAHITAKDHGFWDRECALGDQFANMHRELSEAWEEYRKFGLDPAMFLRYAADGKPEGIAVEFADLIIRIADTCKRYEIPLGYALCRKMLYNQTRPYRHGGKHA